MGRKSAEWIRDNAAYLKKISTISFEHRRWDKKSIVETRDILGPWRHNIKLPFGVYTAHVADYYPAHRIIMQVINQQLHGEFAGRRIVDIGCLEGYFSAECALHGAGVLGIDGKTLNIQKCEFIRSVLGIPGMRFTKDDAMRVTRRRYGTFDVAIVLGLLYHLDDPFKFLRNMAEITDGFMILDTHIGLPDPPKALRGGLRPELSAMKRFTVGGKTYHGRLYREFDAGTSQVFKDLSSTASLRNELSVWLTEESLVRLLHEVGFEQTCRYMFPKEDEALWWSDLRRDARVLIVAVKKPLPFQSAIFTPRR